MTPLRVVIADDHQLFAETLGLTLDYDERVQVAGSACGDMPVLDGFRATRLLRRLLPACPVVVLTASPSPDDVHRARAAGAAGYLNKGCSADHLVDALLEACVLPVTAEDERKHQVAQP